MLSANMSRVSLSIFDICIPQCTFPPDCCRLSVRTRPHSLARTLHFQAAAISSPLLSSLVPSASLSLSLSLSLPPSLSLSLSLSYSHCLPLPNRPPFLSSRSFSLSFLLSPLPSLTRHPHTHATCTTYLRVRTRAHTTLRSYHLPCSPHFPTRIQRFMFRLYTNKYLGRRVN